MVQGFLVAGLLIASTYLANAAPGMEARPSATDQSAERQVNKASDAAIGKRNDAKRPNDKTKNERDEKQAKLGADWKAANAAADSAKAAWYTFYLSIVVGIPTLLAAAFAAFYTARSARHARENIEALYEAERGILHAQGGDVGRSTQRGDLMVVVDFINRGRAFAQIIEFGAMKDGQGGGRNAAPRWTFVGPGEVGQVPAFPAPPRGAEMVIDCWIAYRSVGPAIYKSHFNVKVFWQDATYAHGLGSYIGWKVEVSNERGHPDDT